MSEKLYAERDAMELDQIGGHYFKHVMAMTAESLHSKSDIAAELGWRDCKIQQLEQQLAESQSKIAQMAAENSAVKVMNDCLSEELRGYESDGAFDGPKMHLLWWKTEASATDAFLAEVRASAVDSLIGIKTNQLARMHPDTHAFGANADFFRSQINELQSFAALLRKGVRS